MSRWCSTWQKHLNIAKCVSIRLGLIDAIHFTYEISGTSLVCANSSKDLGVIFDGKLNFSDHCNSVANRAMVRTNVLLKCFYSRDSQLQVKLFNACVRPILEYNSPIWSPHLSKDVASIERVQQYFTKNL